MRCVIVARDHGGLHFVFEVGIVVRELELELFLRPTVSRPVILSIGPPFGTLDHIWSCSSCFAWQLRYSSYKAPSLTRKRVCSLQCNHSLVRSLTMADCILCLKWGIVVKDHGGLHFVFEVGHCCEGPWRIAFCVWSGALLWGTMADCVLCLKWGIVVRDHGGLHFVFEVRHCCERPWRSAFCVWSGALLWGTMADCILCLKWGIVVRDHGGLQFVFEVGHCCEGPWRIAICIWSGIFLRGPWQIEFCIRSWHCCEGPWQIEFRVWSGALLLSDY
jgi:hypothetical protein